MKNENSLETLIEVAEYYYNANMTQQEIALKLGITRQSVSKYLENARAQGIVTINVKNPIPETTDLSRKLIETYGNTRMKNIIVVPGIFSDNNTIRKVIAERACEYITRIFNEQSIKRIGVSWGRTVNEMINHFEPRKVDIRCDVVPLLGSTSNSVDYFTVNDMARNFAQKINGTLQVFFLPLDAETEDDYEKYVSTLQYQRLSGFWNSLDMAVVGIGASPNQLLKKRSLYPRESKIINGITSRNPVGDVCTRYFDIEGNIVEPNEKVLISIECEALRRIPRIVALAGGSDKAQSIIGAMKSGLITDLITDESTARAMLGI